MLLLALEHFHLHLILSSYQCNPCCWPLQQAMEAENLGLFAQPWFKIDGRKMHKFCFVHSCPSLRNISCSKVTLLWRKGPVGIRLLMFFFRSECRAPNMDNALGRCANNTMLSIVSVMSLQADPYALGVCIHPPYTNHVYNRTSDNPANNRFEGKQPFFKRNVNINIKGRHMFLQKTCPK